MVSFLSEAQPNFNNMEIRTLTKAEEEIMLILWEKGKGFVKDILAEMPEPKPAYNTVSTIIRILEKKGIVGYTAYGKTHEYYPLISKEDYKKHEMQQLMGNYFENSLSELVSFFVKDKKVDAREMDEILEIINRNRTSK